MVERSIAIREEGSSHLYLELEPLGPGARARKDPETSQSHVIVYYCVAYMQRSREDCVNSILRQCKIGIAMISD